MILVKLINDIISTTACAVVENKPIEGSEHVQKLIDVFAHKRADECGGLPTDIAILWANYEEIGQYLEDVVINSNFNNNGTETNLPKQV